MAIKRQELTEKNLTGEGLLRTYLQYHTTEIGRIYPYYTFYRNAEDVIFMVYNQIERTLVVVYQSKWIVFEDEYELKKMILDMVNKYTNIQVDLPSISFQKIEHD
jgi:hypothetical protein